jgi:hypothetical protein
VAGFPIDYDSIDEGGQMAGGAHDRITDGNDGRGFVVRHRFLLLRAPGDNHDRDKCGGWGAMPGREQF